MFKKILIANRGEIACRVMQTARRLGIRTVAIYSDADANSKHVAMADEAYRVGPPAVAESYLNIPAIIEACRQSGAEAVHPGYGFLSENPDFVDALDKAHIVFIGPSAASIRAMGLKDAAKALMQKAGVPVVPGYHGDRQDLSFLKQEADKIGYPVLIKARAGGGGKGMRKVENPVDFEAALKSAQREGEASFGDGRVLIEKYLAKPRHIEIQVFGDNYGNIVHLFERDCSLQRRHQKVIEEAPAPGMTETMRKAMGKAAVKAASAVNYSGAGTIEFIADVSEGLNTDDFYFMEMNTRLQVEHPVTELITNEDLVEWQMNVAAGYRLPKTQEALSIDGWAFEARLYAEDASKGFLPSIGTLEYLAFPENLSRIDSGVRQGDEITPHYDPMIAKLIVKGPTRQAALSSLLTCLEQTKVAGCVTNASFLSKLCQDQHFATGDVDTGLIERELPTLTLPAQIPTDAIALAAFTALGFTQSTNETGPFETLVGWRLWSISRQFACLEVEGKKEDFEVHALGNDTYNFHLNDEVKTYKLVRKLEHETIYQCEGKRATATIARAGQTISVFLDGKSFEFGVPTQSAQSENAEGGGSQIVAPMPGLVKLLSAQADDFVSKEQPLIVLEAMKMEHTLKAPRDGRIEKLYVVEGDQVTDGTVLLSLTKEEEDAEKS